MKTFLKTLLAFILATTFLLTGCETPDVSDGVSSDVGEPTPEISPEDLALAEKATVDFGVLHNVEEWDNAEKDIPVYMFVRWYLEYVNSITTYEERLELYRHENYETGWVYPQEELETYVQKYFDVSTEYLRSGDCYYAEDGIYNLDYIGGANLSYKVRLSETKPTVDGDIMYIPMELSWLGNFDDTTYRTLVIQKTEDGYKYLKSIPTVEKVDFLGYSMLVPKDMKVENSTVYYNNVVEFIKMLEVHPINAFEDVLLDADKKYKESEFFVSESEYSADNVYWKEYTVKIPLPEDSGLSETETFSYYVIKIDGRVILMQTRPLIHGAGGSQREKIENILKTIEYTD